MSPPNRSQRIVRDMRRLVRAYQTMSKCNAILVKATDETGLADRICRLLVSGGYALAWIGVVSSERQKEISLIARAGNDPVDFVRMDATWKRKLSPSGSVSKAMKTGRVQVIHEQVRVRPLSPFRSVYKEHASSAIVPIFLNGKFFWILNVCSNQRDALDAKEVTLLTELARGIGFGIASIRQRTSLIKTEKDLLEAQHLAHVGNFTWNVQTGESVWSRETYAITGQNPKTLHPTFQTMMSMTHPEDRALVEYILGNAIRNKKEAEAKFRIMRKNGSVRIVNGKARVTFDEKGKPTIGLGTIQDITEIAYLEESLRKKTEERLELGARYEALLSSLGDGVYAVDAQGRIIYMNSAAEALVGYRFAEIEGRPYIDLWDLEDKNGKPILTKDRPIFTALKTKKRISASHIVIVRHDGTRIPVSVTSTPVGSGNEIFGGITVIKDATRESRIEQAKDEFISLASHQLRTPLSVIKWYSDALRGGSKKITDAKQLKYIDEIAASNERLIDLVNALLNISRIEQGKFIAAPERINLHDLISQTLDVVAARVAQKKLSFQERVTGSEPVYLDPRMLGIVLQNLVTNAVAYTPSGGKLGLNLQVKSKKLLIEVWDTGIGIPKTEQIHLFERFYRAQNARSAEPNGTGLGLYIIKTVLATLGGTIRFVSAEGKGTTFIVEIPLNVSGRSVMKSGVAIGTSESL